MDSQKESNWTVRRVKSKAGDLGGQNGRSFGSKQTILVSNAGDLTESRRSQTVWKQTIFSPLFIDDNKLSFAQVIFIKADDLCFKHYLKVHNVI